MTPSPFCMSCKISEILVVMKRQVANGVWNKIKVNTLSKRYCFSQSPHVKNYDNFSYVWYHQQFGDTSSALFSAMNEKQHILI